MSELLGGKPSTNFTYSSPLTDIFKADWLVAGHLHLMAIQTLVYTNLGRPDLVQANLAFVMAQVPVPPQTASPYVTAWRIVNDPTFPQYIGVDPFIHELVISK